MTRTQTSKRKNQLLRQAQLPTQTLIIPLALLPPLTAHRIRGWGGKRAGAGAPVSNLNRLIHGGQSKLLKRGIERMCDDPEMRAVLHIIARLATEGSVPPQTKRTVQAIMNRKGASYATR